MSFGLSSFGLVSLGLSPDAPAAAGGTTVSPGVGSVLVTGYAPTVVQTTNQIVAPDTGSLVITGHAPTVVRTSGQTIAPGAGALTLTGNAPTVIRTAHHIVAPGAGALTLTGHAPAVLQTTGITVQPGVGALVLTGYAPTVARTAHQIVKPAVGELTVTGYAPTISQAGPPADPRYARPQSDVSAGAWTPSSGTALYAMIDEPSADSADYISTSTPSTCEVKLNPVVDPGTSSGQVARYQVWSLNGDGLTVRLKQGATVIATWTHATLPTTPTIFVQSLTAAECDSITNYADLRFAFEAT